MPHNILLIDDNEGLLLELEHEANLALVGQNVTVQTWVPENEDDARSSFLTKINSETILVVTDYDLTTKGQTGLFGASVVDWSQLELIPVGDFSRGHPFALPKVPNTFEIRIPTNATLAGPFIASICKGFLAIRQGFANNEHLLDFGSPSSALAAIIGAEEEESQISLYGLRLSTLSGALVSRMAPGAPGAAVASRDDKVAVLTYVVGHLLLNAVLKYPGPILSVRALAAYCGVDTTETESLNDFFEPSKYNGPFSELDSFYWLSKVERQIQPLMGALGNVEFETQGEFNREALEKHLGKVFDRHDCPRCQGQQGGFLCPFTMKTVCQRASCSVGVNSWIPQGANLCRIEKTYFDEWAPMLGY